MKRIRRFFDNLKRSTKWFFRMWNNYDWDYCYLIRTILYKLKDMRYQFDETDSWYVDLRHQPNIMTEEGGSDSVDVLKELDEAIELGEKLLTHDYFSPMIPEHVNKWFDENRGNFELKVPEDIRMGLKNGIAEGQKRETEDRDKFFDIIKKYHTLWWD